MPEPLKNLLHPALVETMGRVLAAHSGDFDRQTFLSLALDNLENLELMQRSLQICDALSATLPDSFVEAAMILARALPGGGRPDITGWALLPVNQYIARKGLAHFDLSLALLKQLTPHFTAEFGIRPFIAADQARALATMIHWADDRDHHVRRLASEGARPRLPWAMRLPQLIRDPAPLLPLLARLVDDPSDYVRRSVANSLNDIARDHPDLVAGFVAGHVKTATPERLQLLRHASRTLLKKGHMASLANFGFEPAQAISGNLLVDTPNVMFGEALAFSIGLENEGESEQLLMIDYVIHHLKANGAQSPKVFKWKSLRLKPGSGVRLERRHAMRAITTRQYYPGRHRLEILVNGAVLQGCDFHLDMAGISDVRPAHFASAKTTA